jgi:hypothetical protein
MAMHLITQGTIAGSEYGTRQESFNWSV